jgi:hypothetical protein
MVSLFGEQDFPIGRLILDRARALGLSRTKIVRRLGYTDLSSGHRAPTDLMMTGTVPPFFTRLADALEVEPSIVESVLIATARQQDAEAAVHVLAREEAYRAAFQPHLQVQTERRNPSPIFVAAILTVRRLRIVDLDGLPAGQDERNEIVRAVIVSHHREHVGYVPAFGKITGYVLVVLAGYGGMDFGLPFDRTGYPTGSMVSVQRLPEAMLGQRRLGGRLTGCLRTCLYRSSP